MGKKRINLTDVPKPQWKAQAGPIKPTPVKQIMQRLFTFAENTLKCSLQKNYSWKRNPQERSSWHFTQRTLDSSCLQYSSHSRETWLCDANCPSLSTSSPWVSPVLLWHPQCCDMSLAPVCQPCHGFPLHWGSLLYWLWVLNLRSAALGSGEKWRTLSILWTTRVKINSLISDNLSHRYKLLALITHCSRILPGIDLFVWIFQ